MTKREFGLFARKSFTSVATRAIPPRRPSSTASSVYASLICRMESLTSCGAAGARRSMPQPARTSVATRTTAAVRRGMEDMGDARDCNAASPRRSARGGGDDGLACEQIHAIVQRVSAVALDLVPGHVVPARLHDEAFPEVAVRHRLLARAEPAVPFPALPPAVAEAVHDVGGIGVERDLDRAGNRREPLDGGAQLHALIGGVGLEAREGALVAAVEDERRPAPRTGVAAAGAVRVERRRQGVSCQ